MGKVSRTTVCGLAFALVGAGYLLAGRPLPLGSLVDPGSGFFPLITGVALVILSIIMILADRLKKNKTKQNGVKVAGDNYDPAKVVKYMVALIIYAGVLQAVGFLITTAALLFVVFRIMRFKNTFVSFVVAIVSSVVFYYLFSYPLEVSLPKGFLEFI